MKGTNVATMTGDGSVRQTETQKPRKFPVRVHFARVGPVEVGAGLFMFSLTKAGLCVHKRNARRKTDLLLPFDRLTGGGGIEWMDGKVPVRFCVTSGGLEVRRGGSKKVALMPFSQIANLTAEQPLLFAGLESGT